MSENIGWDRIIELSNEFTNALTNLAHQLNNIILPLAKALNKAALEYQFKHRRVSYNAKYWRITDDRKLDIDLMINSMQSNEKCYYSKMDR